MKKSWSKYGERNWCFIIYPESTTIDWLDTLKSFHLPFAISPLHQPDAEASKPHIHVLCCSLGKMKKEDAEGVTKSVNGTAPFPCASKRGYHRYLIHLDDPDKEQFKRDSILYIGGFKVSNDLESDKSETSFGILEYCKLNNIKSFAMLVDTAVALKDADWLESLKTHAYFYNSYLKSYYRKEENNE